MAILPRYPYSSNATLTSSVRSNRFCREKNRECGPDTGFAFAFDGAVMGVDDSFCNCESQAAALRARGISLGRAIEAFENVWQMLFGDANTLILELDSYSAETSVFTETHFEP